jgi:hypothetical protein
MYRHRYIHPSTQPPYSTKTCSRTLASPNFCLQSILFRVVSFQLQHQKSLATSSFTLSSQNLCLPMDRMSVNSPSRAFFGYTVKRGSLYKSSPTVVSWIYCNTLGRELYKVLHYIWSSISHTLSPVKIFVLTFSFKQESRSSSVCVCMCVCVWVRARVRTYVRAHKYTHSVDPQVCQNERMMWSKSQTYKM